VREFLSTFVKLCILAVAAFPITLDFILRSRHKKNNHDFPLKNCPNDKKVTYFDRHVIDNTADAGAKTIYESIAFLREKNIKTQYVLLSGTKESELKKLEDQVDTKKSFEYRNFLDLRQTLIQSNYIFVKTPENMFLLSCILVFCRDRPIIWYYGGDIYSLRYKTALTNLRGFAYANCIFKYLLYSLFEFLLWPLADTCLSPNEEEASVIRRFNKESLVLPIRMFRGLDRNVIPEESVLKESDDVQFIFVGGAGHAPNIVALHYAVTIIMPELKKYCSHNIVLNIVGAGWDSSDYSDWLASNKDCLVHGRISDYELDSLYRKCKFALAPVQDGAGVKGKVIEAMYKKMIVITTSIGAQGIPSDVLPTFDTISKIPDYVNFMLNNSDELARTTHKYHEFLEEYYSASVYDKLFSRLLVDS
jgi:hypothetical protein